VDESFDVVVIGAGPAGETVASRVGAGGLRAALIERELIGGECAYWACLPSKTLLRAAEIGPEAERVAGTGRPAQKWDDVAAYRDYMVRDLDDADEEKNYEEQGVRVFRGSGAIVAPGRVRVGDEEIEGKRIVIATGSETLVPEIDGLERHGYWTNRDVTGMSSAPASACVLGGGPVGIELAQLLRRFGTEVHLVEQNDRLLSREDERAGELIREALENDGIEVRVGAEVSAVTDAGAVRVSSGEEIACERIVVATSRVPRAEGIGLEHLGVEVSPERGIDVDERCQVRGADDVYAIGDVTGVMPFSHVAMYQGRVVVDTLLGKPARADYRAVPRTVFCDPEAAAVGLTERQARDSGIDAASVTLELRDAISRPWTYETDPRGEVCVVADRQRRVLVGAWAVAPLAGEWIHYAALAVKAQIPLDVLSDTVAQFPTYTEIYEKAIAKLDL
jgi:pyruvate/2-oxoglutarate dehydrogenase complex dihydrolipoamide dehydrogenase (E3) component